MEFTNERVNIEALGCAACTVPADTAQPPSALGRLTRPGPTGISSAAAYGTLAVEWYPIFHDTITISCSNSQVQVRSKQTNKKRVWTGVLEQYSSPSVKADSNHAKHGWLPWSTYRFLFHIPILDMPFTTLQNTWCSGRIEILAWTVKFHIE